jgi:ABC-type nitrate/sulfonate/bicarbonate transport system substrate-binding protein
MKKSIIILLSVVMCMSVFAGCGNSANKDETIPTLEMNTDENVKTTFGLVPFKEKQTLKIGFFTGSPLSYPFLFADKLNYFKELNIEIEYMPFTNGPGMMEANAEWDIAGAGVGGLANGMRAYGLKVIDITDYEENLALFARPDSPLAKDPKNPDNWKGTNWVYPAGTTAQATLVSALEKVDLSIKDIKSTNMDVANALTGFKGGTGDGLAVWNAIAFAAEDEGFVRIGDSGTLGFPAPCGTVVSDKTLQEKRKLIETAIAVFHFTSEWINESDENKKQAADWYLEDCKNEGVKADESIAKRVIDWYRGPTMAEYIDLYTTKSPDDAGLYKTRDLFQAEKDILVGLDFFISQGNYKPEARTKFLDDGLIDPSVALGVKEMLDNLEIAY